MINRLEDYFNEMGGRHLAKQLLYTWVKENATSDIRSFSLFTGLPNKIVETLLLELEQEGAIKRLR